MNDSNVFVGMDYHKDSIQVCVMEAAGHVLGNRVCANDPQAVATYVSRHGRVAGAALESCEGTADFAEGLIALTGWSVDLAHPGYVHRLRQNPDKTDYSDARLLADLERVGYVPRVWLAPQRIRELRRLVRYRRQLVNARRNVKLRIRALLREHRRTSSSPRWGVVWYRWMRSVDLPDQSRWILDRHLDRLSQLNDDVKIAERRLEEVTKQDAVVERLLSLPGVGPVTAWVLRAEVGRFDRFRSGKQLARFCGLTPRNASSGQRQADAGLIRSCNNDLRSVLIEAGHRLRRYDARWSALSHRLRESGKPGSVIVVAVANRWMRWLYHEMKTDQVA
ncbi:MAG: IS110 family transposase [bacterium]|nr:IS110 family transposase [bacterium]